MAKKKKKKAVSKETQLQHWLVQKLRRISYMWPPRKEAIKKARVERGKYRCSSCQNLFGRQEIQLDHVIPVIDPHKGFEDWNTFIVRLFSDEDNFSVKCKPCHKYKSLQENFVRRQIKNDKDGNKGDL